MSDNNREKLKEQEKDIMKMTQKSFQEQAPNK